MIKLKRVFETLLPIACGISFLTYFYIWHSRGGFLWDLVIYENAVSLQSIGKTPYQNNYLLFIYHPYVVWIFDAINSIFTLRMFLYTFYALSILLFSRELYLFLEGKLKEFWLVIICVFCIGSSGVIAILSGNISWYLHLALLSMAFICLRLNGRYLPIYLFLILTFSLVKPYLLTYLLLVFSFEKFRKSIIASIGVFGIFCCVWFSAIIYQPVEYSAFLGALKEQTLIRQDHGFSFFGALKTINIFGSDRARLAAHILLSSLLVMAIVPVVLRRNYIKNHSRTLFIVMLPVLVLINPRVKEYDFFILLVGLFLIIFSQNRINRWRAQALSLFALVIAFIPVLLGIIEVDPFNDFNAFFDKYIVYAGPFQLLSAMFIILYFIFSGAFSKNADFKLNSV